MVARMVAEEQAGALGRVYREIRSKMALDVVPNVFKAMAAVNPDVLIQNWTAYRRTVLEGELPRWVKEMIGLVVARASSGDYGLEFHAAELERLGIDQIAVAQLEEQGESPAVTAAVSSLLRFAVDFARDPDRTDTSLLEAAGLSEEQVQEVM
ncbi:MAG: carboxymuconolactone decarboxylase family protein, partial [Mycobacterium leprae]